MGTDLAREIEEKKERWDYERIASSQEFKNFVTAKKKFLVPLIIFFLSFYILLPILTSYSDILNSPAVGSISWVWIYALSQFIMTWTLCTIYVKKAASFDQMAQQIINNNVQGREMEQ